ncbi:hypothetical protein AB0D47_37080 [Streptomyces sp. NPDC048376]|uniref:hypothetical protein n=1 Tax=unclassified Streptomyces TaxID=2593676 RepID=UPI0034334828
MAGMQEPERNSPTSSTSSSDESIVTADSPRSTRPENSERGIEGPATSTVELALENLDSLPERPPGPDIVTGAPTLQSAIRESYPHGEPWYSPQTGAWHYMAEGYKILSATAGKAGTAARWAAEHRGEFLEGVIGGIPPALRGIGALAQSAHLPPDTTGQKVFGFGVALTALARINELATEAAKAYGIYRHPDQAQPGVNSLNVAMNVIGTFGDVMNGIGTSGSIKDPHWAQGLQGVGALVSAISSLTTPFTKLQQTSYEPQVLPRHNVQTPAEELRGLPNRHEELQEEADAQNERTSPAWHPPGRAAVALLPVSTGLLHQRRVTTGATDSGSSAHSPVADPSSVRNVNITKRSR